MSIPTLRPVPPLPDDLPETGGEYEYRVLTIPYGYTGAEVRRLLTEHAEYGHWELARVRLLVGGRRRVWVRRRIIRIVRPA